MGGSRLRHGAPQLFLELARYRFSQGGCSKAEALRYAEARTPRPTHDQKGMSIEEEWWLRRIKNDRRAEQKAGGRCLRRTKARECAVYVDSAGGYWTEERLDELWASREAPRVVNYLCVVLAREVATGREVRAFGVTSQADGTRLAQIRYAFKGTLEVAREHELLVPVTLEPGREQIQEYQALVHDWLVEAGCEKLTHLGREWFLVERQLAEDLVLRAAARAAEEHGAVVGAHGTSDPGLSASA